MIYLSLTNAVNHTFFHSQSQIRTQLQFYQAEHLLVCKEQDLLLKTKAEQEVVLAEANSTIDAERGNVTQLEREISILKQQIVLFASASTTSCSALVFKRRSCSLQTSKCSA